VNVRGCGLRLDVDRELLLEFVVPDGARRFEAECDWRLLQPEPFPRAMCRTQGHLVGGR